MILCRAGHLSSAGAVVALLPVTSRSRSRVRPATAALARGRSTVSACLPPAEHRVKEGSWSCRCAASGEVEGEEKQERVHCEVEVVSWRERRVRAWVLVDADADTVWGVLTDYEQLADFIPNLVCSGTIPCPHPGRVWLEQRGLQRALYWHIEARVVLDLQEFHSSTNGRELRFSMVDGDFKKFEGKWSVRAGLRSCTSILYYEVNVIPRFNFPAIFLERIIRSDLPVNLLAVADRAERNSNETILKLVSDAPLPSASGAPSVSNISQLSNSLTEKEKLISSELKENYANLCFGVNRNWGFGKVCDLDRPCMVDEVHLRRYDGLLENGGVHRCVVASITVKSPVREVWNVLTAYDALPEIVPNLAISKVIFRENNKVRILQEGCKGLLYMVLHARVVLDLWEQFEQEIRFEQVEGDFDSFQGKWLLEQLGNQHTLLKYVVESKMQKNSFLSEAIFEEVIYEDLPSNLSAIRDFVERRGVMESNSSSNDPIEETIGSDEEANDELSEASDECDQFNDHKTPKQRPRVPGLQREIEVLKEELSKFISENGQEGFMPMRKQLRMHGRVDIEKAINRMGGFRKIASLMNLSLAYKHRKPKGYWDDLDNLQEEITRFQRSWGMDLAYMPSRKIFERAGRYDIARALEKWGGIREVSRLLSLKVRYPSREANFGGREKKNDAATSSGQEKTPKKGRSSVLHDSQKWLMELKQLEMKWVD